jgi:hypothetical protein
MEKKWDCSRRALPKSSMKYLYPKQYLVWKTQISQAAGTVPLFSPVSREPAKHSFFLLSTWMQPRRRTFPGAPADKKQAAVQRFGAPGKVRLLAMPCLDKHINHERYARK